MFFKKRLKPKTNKKEDRNEINFNHFKSKYINNEITDLVIRPGEIEVWVA